MKFPFINHEIELMIENGVMDYLHEISREHFFESLNCIIKEVAGNANKANMKRVHFNRKGLSVESGMDYDRGIETFQREMNESPNLYFELAEKLGYFVKISLYLEGRSLLWWFLTTAGFYPLKLNGSGNPKAGRFKTLEQVFEEGLDLR